jgi:hypothetical protein
MRSCETKLFFFPRPYLELIANPIFPPGKFPYLLPLSKQEKTVVKSPQSHDQRWAALLPHCLRRRQDSARLYPTKGLHIPYAPPAPVALLPPFRATAAGMPPLLAFRQSQRSPPRIPDGLNHFTIELFPRRRQLLELRWFRGGEVVLLAQIIRQIVEMPIGASA